MTRVFFVVFLTLSGMIASVGAAQDSLTLSAQTQTQQDWQLRCPDQQSDKNECEITHTAAVEVEGKPVSLFILSMSKHTDPTKLYAILFVPHGLNLLLPQAGKMAVARDAVDFPWLNCTELGCWSHQAIDQDTIADLRGKSTATMSLALSDGTVVDINFSLMGFSKSLDLLRANNG